MALRGSKFSVVLLWYNNAALYELFFQSLAAEIDRWMVLDGVHCELLHTLFCGFLFYNFDELMIQALLSVGFG